MKTGDCSPESVRGCLSGKCRTCLRMRWPVRAITNQKGRSMSIT